MKRFDRLEELWEYCLLCPICHNLNRTTELIIGPEDIYQLYDYKKYGSYLSVLVRSRNRDLSIYRYEFIFDCINNTFTLNKKYENSPDIDKFYLYFYSNCEKCDSYINSGDIILDFKNNNIENIFLDREGVILLDFKDRYNITIDHADNCIDVHKFIPDDGKEAFRASISLPMIDLDLSKQNMVLHKIKTLLVFS
jgi:hypothetical protein